MFDVTTLGGLREALSLFDPSAKVFINGRPPTALSSYRGYYKDLAIEASGAGHERTELSGRPEPFEINLLGYGTYYGGHMEVRIVSDPTVADLIKALGLADGEVFEGYKGGQYEMHSNSLLWVSNYGQCDGLQVESVSLNRLGGSVDLRTVEVGW